MNLQGLSFVSLGHRHLHIFIAETVSRLRNLVQFQHHPSVNGGDVVEFILHIEIIEHLFQVGAAQDPEGSILHFQDFLSSDFIVLVVDFPYQLFDDVFHGDDSFGSPVFIHHHRDMSLGNLHFFQQVGDPHRAGNKDDWLDVFGYAFLRVKDVIMKVLLIQHPDDFVQAVFIDGQPGETGFQKQFPDFLFGGIDLDGFHLYPGGQYIVGIQLVEFNGILDQLTLLFVDAPFMLRFFHHDDQLVFRDGPIPGNFKKLADQLLPHGKHPVQRCQKDHENPKDRS